MDARSLFGSRTLDGLARITVLVALSVTAAMCCRAQAVAKVSAAQVESVAPGRLVVVYRSGFVPAGAEAVLSRAGVRSMARLPLFGAAAVQVDGDTDAAVAKLMEQPEVAMVLRDRYVRVHAMQVLPVDERGRQRPAAATVSRAVPRSDLSVVGEPADPPRITLHAPTVFPAQNLEDLTYYESPQGWATRLAGGYGAKVAGGPAVGPWDVTEGAGVRIAVLDSGVDAEHPAIAPNVVLNLSEVNQDVLPSACDDGSPVDQSGHGTFTASLAAATTDGMVIGVAPRAQILNIKVVQRMPGLTGASPQAQCEAGAANGLLSWVLQGIQDAVANHATVISLSLGTLVDISTGDGAGWLAEMNSVTYAAAQAGAVLVAAAGNDGLDLSGGRYVELPAQARGVLAVVASTNPDCAENLTANARCTPGPVKRAYYSNYGANLNAIAAPGGSYPEGGDFAVSGFVRGACAEGLPKTTDGLPANGQSFGCFGFGHARYVQAMGTSAAVPLVAGAAALLQAAHPSWTPTQVTSALQSTAMRRGTMAEPEIDLPSAMKLQ